MKITFLGTGSGVCENSRFCSAAAVTVKGVTYVIDAGAPISTLLQTKGIRLETVKALFITHNHGDHVGMIPAFIDDTDVHFALPQTDFEAMAGRFPAQQQSFITDGYVFNLGGKTLKTIEVPGHTDGSVVLYLCEENIIFSGDAIGSGHGVWIFNEASYRKYTAAVPYLIGWLTDKENGVDIESLRIYGGHYWQRDWLPELGDKEMGVQYLRDMSGLLDQIDAGTAATEPSGLDHRVLDTYFRNGSAIVVWNASQAEAYRLAE